ncbi:hypothetical protein BU17DRAFT_94225 [Hysterangium stoloniferum]|nr:hypothetical protein BU17DRAFT_94225 [Hysterangium stoloniferum]
MSTLEKIKDYESSTGSAYQVFPKLRKDNYFTWSASMKTVLKSLNQWKVIIGELADPARAKLDALTKDELDIEEAWVLRKKRAYSEIMLRVEDEPRVAIMTNDNPIDAWNKLKNTYGTRLANSQAILLSELLLEAGHSITDSDYLSLFMSTLPEDFDIMSTTIDYDKDTVEEITVLHFVPKVTHTGPGDDSSVDVGTRDEEDLTIGVHRDATSVGIYPIGCETVQKGKGEISINPEHNKSRKKGRNGKTWRNLAIRDPGLWCLLESGDLTSQTETFLARSQSTDRKMYLDIMVEGAHYDSHNGTPESKLEKFISLVSKISHCAINRLIQEREKLGASSLKQLHVAGVFRGLCDYFADRISSTEPLIIKTWEEYSAEMMAPDQEMECETGSESV